MNDKNINKKKNKRVMNSNERRLLKALALYHHMLEERKVAHLEGKPFALYYGIGDDAYRVVFSPIG